MKNIFVGNLSFSTTEQDIRSLFEAYGTVDRVNIVTDRDSGQPRGFAFVEMANDAEGNNAIAVINGQEVGGRACTDEILLVACDVEQIDQGARVVSGDLRRYRLVRSCFRAIEAGYTAAGFLNSGIKQPLAGPRQRQCIRQEVSLAFA